MFCNIFVDEILQPSAYWFLLLLRIFIHLLFLKTLEISVNFMADNVHIF